MDNPSNYFTSNTTVVFPPGHHEVSTEGQLVIQNVNNISLVGDNDNSTMIKCTGQFGFAFINITNLNVSKLSFSMCGAPISNPSQTNLLLNEIKDSFYISQVCSTVSIYLLHITNFNATNLSICHSKDMGLLGVNVFGVSSIQQAVFANNTPNCVIVFLGSYSLVETPIVHITDSLFLFGTRSADHYEFAAGFNIIATKNLYQVNIYIRNITVYGNTASRSGNIILRINCKVAIQVTHVNSLLESILAD